MRTVRKGCPFFYFISRVIMEVLIKSGMQITQTDFSQAEAAPGLHESDAGILDVFQGVFVQ